MPERQPLQQVHGLLHDPNSGYDWLPLSESRQMSAETIYDRLAPGGQWEDFSVASADQVEQLVLNQLHAAA